MSDIRPYRIAVPDDVLTDLRDRLILAHKKLSENAGRIRDKSGTYFFRDRLCPRGRIAFLFPGAVSFYPDMLRDLSLVFEECREAFDELEEALQTTGDGRFSPADYVFPPATCYRNDSAAFPANAGLTAPGAWRDRRLARLIAHRRAQDVQDTEEHDG